MTEKPSQKVHASYELWTGTWSTPVCLATRAAAESYTAAVDRHLGRAGKRRWRYLPCSCPPPR